MPFYDMSHPDRDVSIQINVEDLTVSYAGKNTKGIRKGQRVTAIQLYKADDITVIKDDDLIRQKLLAGFDVATITVECSR